MTEEEWIACTDPDAMAVFLYDRCKEDVAGRKLGLLACACVRRIWHLLADERSRRGIEVAERYLNDSIPFQSLEEWSQSEVALVHSGAFEAWGKVAEVAADGDYSSPMLRAMPDAGLAAYQVLDGDVQCLGNASSAAAYYAAPGDTPEWQTAKEVEQRAQVAIIRELFPNPFQT